MENKKVTKTDKVDPSFDLEQAIYDILADGKTYTSDEIYCTPPIYVELSSKVSFKARIMALRQYNGRLIQGTNSEGKITYRLSPALFKNLRLCLISEIALANKTLDKFRESPQSDMVHLLARHGETVVQAAWMLEICKSSLDALDNGTHPMENLVSVNRWIKKTILESFHRKGNSFEHVVALACGEIANNLQGDPYGNNWKSELSRLVKTLSRPEHAAFSKQLEEEATWRLAYLKREVK